MSLLCNISDDSGGHVQVVGIGPMGLRDSVMGDKEVCIFGEFFQLSIDIAQLNSVYIQYGHS